MYKDRIAIHIHSAVAEYDVTSVTTSVTSGLYLETVFAVEGTVLYDDMVGAPRLAAYRHSVPLAYETIPHVDVARLALEHYIVITSMNVATVYVYVTATHTYAVGIV